MNQVDDIGELDAVFERIKAIIAEECFVSPEDVTLDSNLIDDLEIDSLDLLNGSFRIEREFGIKIPIQQWVTGQAAGQGLDALEITMRALCEFVLTQTQANHQEH